LGSGLGLGRGARVRVRVRVREAGATMQSCMIPFQLSPVAHRNIVRKAVPG